MERYTHSLPNWPQFQWSHDALALKLAAVRHRQGRFIGRMEGLGFRLRAEAVLQSLSEETLKSNEIEGEMLDPDQVRSSIARRLGIDIGALAPADRKVEGVVAIILDATQNYTAPLTKARLFDWHAALFPTGRTGMTNIRAIADMALARSEGSPQRFYSVSAQIRIERAAYYGILEATQKGDMEIAGWIEWFLGCLDRSFDGAELLLASVLTKARFWERHAGAPLQDRQRLVINRLLDGFEDKLTCSKYAKLNKCSQDTASRDIDDLMTREILLKDSAGDRSTSYALAPVEP